MGIQRVPPFFNLMSMWLQPWETTTIEFPSRHVCSHHAEHKHDIPSNPYSKQTETNTTIDHFYSQSFTHSFIHSFIQKREHKISCLILHHVDLLPLFNILTESKPTSPNIDVPHDAAGVSMAARQPPADFGGEFSEKVFDQVCANVRREINRFLNGEGVAEDEQGYRCMFCPFRAFKRTDRLRAHVRRYHTATRNFCANGRTKAQWHLALAIFEQAQANQTH